MARSHPQLRLRSRLVIQPVAESAIFSLQAPSALQAADFVVGTVAVDADQNIIYDKAGGKLFYDADGSGAQVQFAAVTANLALTASHFTVV